MNHTKYRPFPVLSRPERRWPSCRIKKAPVWCSVDLRDGNQSLETPMTLAQKIDFFQFLIHTGFKEIEIGFPAASDTEYEFTRYLIENNLIPEDVVIQVLTQSREHIIRRTFESLQGVGKAVVHLYNSTSTLQRRVVFQKSRDEIIRLAVDGAITIRELAEQYGREHFLFEYSPESFSGTEMDFAAEICNAVLDVWQPDALHPVIINLPNTVEMATPNVFADQVEYMCDCLPSEHVIVSVHTHNDRGTAVAATELSMMAGAVRVEGTLFGNGERTGNADILTIAMNLYSQGIDPGLDFSHIDDMIDMYEKSTDLRVHPRHPYAGTLVYTAFSGSHQDAIKKGMAAAKENPGHWEIPYLPIDPRDVGRSYAPIIRINSQSGKGGVAFILEQVYGILMPKRMQPHFGAIATGASDAHAKELQPEEIYELFKATYVNLDTPLNLISHREQTNGDSRLHAVVSYNGEQREIQGFGNGIVDAFCKAVYDEWNIQFEIKHYNEHSLEYGSKSRAITYVELAAQDRVYFGAGVSSSITRSSLRAVVSAINKMFADE